VTRALHVRIGEIESPDAAGAQSVVALRGIGRHREMKPVAVPIDVPPRFGHPEIAARSLPFAKADHMPAEIVIKAISGRQRSRGKDENAQGNWKDAWFHAGLLRLRTAGNVSKGELRNVKRGMEEARRPRRFRRRPLQK